MNYKYNFKFEWVCLFILYTYPINTYFEIGEIGKK